MGSFGLLSLSFRSSLQKNFHCLPTQIIFTKEKFFSILSRPTNNLSYILFPFESCTFEPEGVYLDHQIYLVLQISNR